ncbi:MAG: type II and III secretion system protein family protein [Alphaproteobacteria bacterium]
MKSVLNLVAANSRKLQASVCLVAFLLGFVTAFDAKAYAADVAPQTVAITVHGGRLLRLPGPAANVFVADPEIADVQVPAANSVYVLGKKAGRTSVYALNGDGEQVLAANLVVTHDVGTITTLLKAELPNDKVTVRSVPGGLVITGDVSSSQDAAHAVSLLDGFLGQGDKIINQLSVRSPTQVNLRVRIAEMSRQVEKQLGFNWDTIFNDGTFNFSLLSGQPGPADTPDLLAGNFVKGNWDVLAMIDALAKEGVITTLAEPNLTAVSGETASFLAGGEFPIPVGVSNSNGTNQVQIQFKQFGVSLDFTPTVLGADRISLKVRPEVSQLSDDFSVVLGNSIRIPGLQVRRAETTVELASGQSFAIAGLMDNRTNNSLAKLPGAGSLPVIGPLFQSTAFQRNESELIIIVTPYVVKPIRIAAKESPTPLDGYRSATDLERVLGQKTSRPQKTPGPNVPVGDNGQHLKGDAGFYY